MDFQTLLEGTMVGAEISALTEAVTIDVSNARNANTREEFVKALLESVDGFLDKFERYSQEIKKITVRNRKIIKENIESFAKAEQAAEKISEGLKRLGYPTLNATSLADALDLIWEAAKRTRAEIIKIRKDIADKIKELEKKLKKSAKSAKSGSSKVELEGIVKDSKTLGEKLLSEGSKEVKSLEKLVGQLNRAVENFEKVIDIVNSEIVRASRVAGVELVRYPNLEQFVDGKDLALVKTKPQEIGKVAHVIETLKSKFNSIIERIAKEINDPSIGSVAAAVAVAVAAYLVLYGAVKSSGGKVGSPAAIGTTLKAAVEVIREGTPGKRVLILFLSITFVSLVGVAGKTGYNYVRKLLENKK